MANIPRDSRRSGHVCDIILSLSAPLSFVSPLQIGWDEDLCYVTSFGPFFYFLSCMRLYFCAPCLCIRCIYVQRGLYARGVDGNRGSIVITRIISTNYVSQFLVDFVYGVYVCVCQRLFSWESILWFVTGAPGIFTYFWYFFFILFGAELFLTREYLYLNC